VQQYAATKRQDNEAEDATSRIESTLQRAPAMDADISRRASPQRNCSEAHII
jgi:hypothetical protein